MKPRRLILTGFMAGELDPHLDGRVETDQYAFGLSECENWVAIPEGPLVKRQGFEFIRPAAASASWLSAFRRSVEQEYVLEWSEGKVRFFTNDARLETAGTAYEVTVPYTAAQAPALSQQQSYDRLYIDHGAHAPGALRRDTPLTFAFETLVLENGPFLDLNTGTTTVSANATTGAITLTASAAIFAAEHAGALFRLEAMDFADIRQWEPGMAGVAIGDKVRNEGRVYTAATAGSTGSKAPTHSEGSYWDGQTKNDLLNAKGPYGVKWTYLHDRFGIAQITAFASATSVSATVLRRLPDSLTTVPSTRWAHAAFSAAEGWPSLVTLYKGRQLHFKDAEVVGSVVGDYGGGRVNFAAYSDSGTIEADLAFRRRIATADEPLWVSGDRKLLLGTASGEIAVGPFNAGAAFSGTNIEAEPQSFYGSEPVFPVQTGTETIFVERGGRRVRSADYDFGRDRYDAPDLNATSRHITAPGIRQLAFQRIPHNLVYGVREDGQLIVHARTRGEIKGWSRFRMGGAAEVLSAVAVVGADGKHDAMWALIERVNGAGAMVREIWKQAYWRELGTSGAESFYVDGGVRIEASGGDGSFTGLEHLAGQAVAVLVNGVVVPGLSVTAGGELTLPAAVVPSSAYIAIVGLAYTARATTMRPEIRDGGGSTAGLRQRVIKAVTRVLETLGLLIAAPGQTTPEQVILREGGQAMDEQVPLYTGDTDGLVDAEFNRDGRTTWISSDPLPATITLGAFNIDVSSSDA